jgi:uncharacterized membrane protein
MGKGRLEAFRDGVTAIIIIIIIITIIITIMVLELKLPRGASVDVLIPLILVLGSYVRSFIYVGIDWNELQYENYPPMLSRITESA